MDGYSDLPWQAQLVAVAGYFGYVVAYVGRRGGHQPIDTAAISLCFGSVCLFVLSLDSYVSSVCPKLPKQVLPIFGVTASIISGALWRAYFRHFAGVVISKLSKSDDDGHLSAWESIIQNQKVDYSQLIVALNDGRVLESYPLGDFNDWPNGPCVLGNDGSIGMYVTNIEEAGVSRETNAISNTDGMRITFIPASQVKEIDFKRSKKVEKKITFFRRFRR